MSDNRSRRLDFSRRTEALMGQHKMWLILIFLCLFSQEYVFGSLNETTIQFIEDYFKYKDVRFVATFTCSKYETYQLTKALASKNFRVVSPDPEKPASAILKSVMKRSYHKYGIFLDYDCECSAGLFLNGSFNWLVWSEQSFPSSIETLNLNIDSEFMWANPEESGKVILYDLYKITYTNPVNATFAGDWDPEGGLNYILTQYIIRRRQNMQKVIFKVGLVVNNIPLENIEEELVKPENRPLDSMATYNWGFFLFLKQMYNFTPEIHITNSFGLVVEEEGNVDGLALMLKNKEIEFGINSYLMNRPRTLLTDYSSTATWDFRICAIFRHPTVTEKLGLLLKPFEPSLWLGCGLLWLLMMAALRFISFFESQYVDVLESGANTGSEQQGAWTWSDTFVIIMGALSQQGSTMDSEWLTGRIVFLNTHILALMMNTFYSAFIVSSLLSAPPKTIKTVRNLIDSPLQFGAEDINYERGYFELSNDPLVQELFQKKMAPPKKGYFSRELGLHKVLTGLFAFHTEAINVYPTIEATFTDQAKCDLTEILIFPIERGYMPVPWGSPHKERITYSFRKFIEGGLINYQNLQWRAAKPPCLIADEIPAVAVNTVSFALWLQLFGVIVAIVIFIFEAILGSR
ncbi:Ionotropic receptor 75v [Blattella germanica]|nr:Ionotropic receptor 75v [Blattella germanica]